VGLVKSQCNGANFVQRGISRHYGEPARRIGVGLHVPLEITQSSE